MVTRPRSLSVAPSASPLAPGRKPMAAARRVCLFEREIRFKLSAAALEILFGSAEVLSEGQRQADRWFGSTMITIDLARAEGRVREECDADSAARVASLIAQDARARARLRAIAEAEAVRRAGGRLRHIDVDLRARAVGSRVQIDLDVEGNLGSNRRSA